MWFDSINNLAATITIAYFKSIALWYYVMHVLLLIVVCYIVKSQYEYDIIVITRVQGEAEYECQ